MTSTHRIFEELKEEYSYSPVNPGYNVQSIGRCRIVSGLVPINDFQMLMHGFSDEAVMSIDIANQIGATFVIGEPEDVKNLGQRDLPASADRKSDAEYARKLGLSDGVINWLLKGKRGASSNAMCKAFFGVPKSATRNHPLDVSDLARCFQFLSVVAPEDLMLMEKIASLSPEWAALESHWNELTASFVSECGADLNGGSAPKTGELMMNILNNKILVE